MSSQWQLPLSYSSNLDARFCPPYPFTHSSCNGPLSTDLVHISTEGSNLSISRRSSNVSPVASMSEEGCYTPISDHDNTGAPDGFSFTYCSPMDGIGSMQYINQHMNTPVVDHCSYGFETAENWGVAEIYPHRTSSYGGRVFLENADSYRHTQSKTRSCSSRMADPSLSRPILFSDGLYSAGIVEEPTFNRMASEINHAGCKTITPKVAFHPMLSNSPDATISPMTPIKGLGSSGFDLTSSPATDLTPTACRGVAFKQDWDAESKTAWESCSASTQVGSLPLAVPEMQPKLEEVPRCESRKQQRKKMNSLRGPKSAAADRCKSDDPLIPPNSFFCSYPGCRQTNRDRTSFRRQEHLKRHEKTVHGDAKPFRCRFCGRGFNRNDNLAQHYKTHSGNRSSSRRNHWVAVLDESSVYHDPDFDGAITRDGYPIRDGIEILTCPMKGCIDVFHTEEALRAHEMKKEHRREGAGLLVAVGIKSKSDECPED